MNRSNQKLAIDTLKQFFARSELFDREATRPLSHIRGNWELTWDDNGDRFALEEDSFAKHLNVLLETISTTPIPLRYHDHEDIIATHQASKAGWRAEKRNGRWVCGDYASLLEQGAFNDLEQSDLIASMTGRIAAALDFGQSDYDSMERGHRVMLADLFAITLYHRLGEEGDGWSDL